MKIPNSFLTDLNRTELMVACKLYSLVNSHTKLNSKGFEVCIKQETIARSCNLSISTTKRILAVLEQKGVIIHRYRKTNSGGFLGAYRYTLKPFSFLSDYFYMRNNIFSLCLSPKQFYLYALCCKLKCNYTSRFFQSYADLKQLTGIKRSELSKIINSLISMKLIRKQRRKTRSGDYTDNTYFVITYQRGRIHKKRKPTCTRLSHESDICLCSYLKPENMIAHSCSFVKSFYEKSTRNRKKIFIFKGGG